MYLTILNAGVGYRVMERVKVFVTRKYDRFNYHNILEKTVREIDSIDIYISCMVLYVPAWFLMCLYGIIWFERDLS